MFRLFLGFIGEEDGMEEYVCEMCGTIYESYEEKEECYHSCLAEIDDEVNIS